jgi:tetratricopeptide (TPR) repeat protein
MSAGPAPNNTDTTRGQNSSEEWLLLRVGVVPRNSLGWFRCGVGFYNKKEYTKSIECFEKSVELDPMNVGIVHLHLAGSYVIVAVIRFLFCISLAWALPYQSLGY